jgi:hypothetical protein
MAIKGKGRTKSRPATRAPRPAPVVRRPPFFLRRWVQLVGALLAGAGIVMVVVWATNGLRSNDASRAAEAKEANGRRVVQEWQATVDGALAEVGSSGGGTGPVVVLPALTASVDTLAKGDADRRAADTAQEARSLVDEAVKTLQGVDLPTLIRQNEGLDVTTTNYVLNSQARTVAGLELYGRVASMVAEATADDVDAATADALVAEAQALLPIAKRVFDQGYADYTEALATFQLLVPSSGLSPGGALPPGT